MALLKYSFFANLHRKLVKIFWRLQQLGHIIQQNFIVALRVLLYKEETPQILEKEDKVFMDSLLKIKLIKVLNMIGEE
jgi:hypothetical protein